MQKRLNKFVIDEAIGTARRTVFIAIAISIAIMAVLAGHDFVSDYQIAQASDQATRAAIASGEVLLADERLTMAANLAAASGQKRWIERYEKNIPLMDAAIAEAKSLAPPAITARFDRETKVANDRLVEMERRSFELDRQGRLLDARALLDSEAYAVQKRNLAEGSNRFRQALLANAQSNLTLIGFYDQWIGSGLLLAAALSFWLLWRTLNNSLRSSLETYLEAEKQAMRDALAQESEQMRRHVTELERTKRELQATTVQLSAALEAANAADRMKSHFISNMSHELRTPLNAILGFSEILKLEQYGPLGLSRYREYATDIFDSGTHLLGLINDILDMSKIDAGQFELSVESIDPAQMVDECVHLVEVQAQKAGVHIAKSVPRDISLNADPRRLRQIVLNLLSNAIKFTPEGGEVLISAWLTNGMFALCVADTGIGIAPENIPRALERFGQIDSGLSRKYEGTGLGLPLCKLLVEQHGGTLDIKSKPGKGTTVTVFLPGDCARTSRFVA